MSSLERSAEEGRKELERKLGQNLGAAFHVLLHDLSWLHVKWHQYRALFGSTPQRVELINGVAPLFFKVVEDTLWDDTLLHIARLTDPVSRGPKRRLSVRCLPALIVDAALRGEVEDLIAIAQDKAEFARDWRNRRIAHKNMAHALDPHLEPLAPASRLAVEDALAPLREVLNCINSRLRDSEWFFEHEDAGNGAEALLYVLRDGPDARERRIQGMRDGTLPPSEWGPPPPI